MYCSLISVALINMESYYECLKSPSKYGYEVEYFWISGVALVSVGFLGFIANALSIIVLCRKNFRKHVFYNLLIELACFDILFISSDAIHVGYKSMACQDSYNPNISHMTYQLLNIGLSGSIYSTVVISIERYIQMCHSNLKCVRSTWIYAISVIVISISYNFPRLLEYQYKVVNGTLIATRQPWAASEFYSAYYIDLGEILVENTIPIMILLSTNGAIIRHMYRSSQMHVADGQSVIRKNRGNASKTLLMVVAAFMISHIPGIVNKFLYHLGCKDCTEEEKTEYISGWNLIHPIGNLGLIVNSSINFIIYCIVGTKFRDELFYLFR